MFFTKKIDSTYSSTLKDAYSLACKTKQIEDNKHQRELISTFDQISTILQARTKIFNLAFLGNWILSKADRRKVTNQKGIYIWGEVGVGKTFMMDLFYDSLPKTQKKRYHFHEFMELIHAMLKKNTNQQRPLRLVSKSLLKNTDILFLDEFYVSDITDAMLLDGLLKSLFEDGIILIATSNSHPDELYKNGLQRERFINAIALLKDNVIVKKLYGNKDYRLQAFKDEGVTSKGILNRDSLCKLFKRLTITHETPASEVDLNGRIIELQGCSQGVAWFTFSQICEGNRSTSEYIDLSRRFHTVLIENIPSMDDAANDAAKRFINLVDELYEKNVNFIASSKFDVAQYYTGKRLSELFKRTESRLLEMLTTNYISRPHLGFKADE